MNTHSDNYYDHNALQCVNINITISDFDHIYAHNSTPVSVCAMLQIQPLTETC